MVQPKTADSISPVVGTTHISVEFFGFSCRLLCVYPVGMLQGSVDIQGSLSSDHTRDLSRALLWFLLIWDFTLSPVTVVAADSALKLLKPFFLELVGFYSILATRGFSVKCFQDKASETENMPLHGSFFQNLPCSLSIAFKYLLLVFCSELTIVM